MKPETPSLILYFFSCITAIFFNAMGDYTFAIYSKGVLVPSIFIYYLITNNYKTDIEKILIFLFSFSGEVYFLIDNTYTEIIPIISFLLVYVFILKYVISDFKKIKLYKKDFSSILVAVLMILVLFFTILNLQFEKMQFDFSFIIIYSTVLGFLSFLSFANFISKPSYRFLNLILMSTCFIISDIFYMLDNFYFSLSTFRILGSSTQVLSYFFMVRYFIEHDKYLQKATQ
ncbi:hypothetical protein D3C86_423440 [compost metagenome]